MTTAAAQSVSAYQRTLQQQTTPSQQTIPSLHHQLFTLRLLQLNHAFVSILMVPHDTTVKYGPRPIANLAAVSDPVISSAQSDPVHQRSSADQNASLQNTLLTNVVNKLPAQRSQPRNVNSSYAQKLSIQTANTTKIALHDSSTTIAAVTNIVVSAEPNVVTSSDIVIAQLASLVK